MAEINSDFRAKKRNVCDNIIFEVDLDDCSPEYSPDNNENGECSQKSNDCMSQDSISEESKLSSQEIEFCKLEISDRANLTESSDAVKEIAIDETDGNAIVVESQNCTVVKSIDDVKTNSLEETECHNIQQSTTTTTTITTTHAIDNDKKQTAIEEYVSNFISDSSVVVSEKTYNEEQQNVLKSDEVKITPIETKEVVNNEVQTQGDVNVKQLVHLNECETVDEIKSKNFPEEGEVIEENSVDISSVISITFKDTTVAKEYKPHFLKFLCAYPELNVIETKEDCLTLKILRNSNPSNEFIVIDEAYGETTKSRSRKRKRSERKKEKDMFMVDTSPSIITKENSSMKYLSKFCVTVDKEEKKVNEVKANTATCFNCDGNHSLKDCTEPKNYSKISMARSIFKNSQTKSARYHLEEDQMYGHLSPGKISEKLRRALGLHKNDLPPYIYRMRVLGYPPGWIKEAEDETSNLCMFDIEGKTVSNHKRKKSSIDPEKIIAYPGFNAPMDKSIYDDYRFYGVPPFSASHDKQVMIDFINKMKEKEEDDLNVCDMDVDQSVEESITEISENDISQDSQDEIQQNSRASPSLTDLESRKQQLLAELDTNTTSDSSVSCKPDTKEPSATVKTSSFGTPILKSASPYSKLPKPDNFSQNISPVINFENLPNATGKYEQMTGILQKVRTALKGLQCKRKT